MHEIRAVSIMQSALDVLRLFFFLGGRDAESLGATTDSSSAASSSTMFVSSAGIALPRRRRIPDISLPLQRARPMNTVSKHKGEPQRVCANDKLQMECISWRNKDAHQLVLTPEKDGVSADHFEV